MRRRVWLYLSPTDATFLSSVGALIGASSRHEQIKFIIKMFRLIVPDPLIVPIIVRNVKIMSLEESSKGKNSRPSERAWVYLSEDDLDYITLLSMRIGEPSIGKTIRYIIRLVRVILPNISEVLEEVKDLMK